MIKINNNNNNNKTPQKKQPMCQNQTIAIIIAYTIKQANILNIHTTKRRHKNKKQTLPEKQFHVYSKNSKHAGLWPQSA